MSVKNARPVNRELPDSQNNGQDTYSVASRLLNRAERTPGAVAVSGGVRQGAGGGENPLPVLPPTNSPITVIHRYACGSKIILAQCETGKHHFAKKILCGKEWCPECGQDDSQTHRRRQARLLPKFQQIASMGYFVIEFPDKYRKVPTYVYSRRGLDIASKIIVAVLAGKRARGGGRKGGYFSRGLLRWHWFGDKRAGKWNPHANIAVDGAFIEPELLNEIKAALRENLHCPDLIVHYSFAETPGQIYQKMRYITRSTFKEYDWNPYMAGELAPKYSYTDSKVWEDEKYSNLKMVRAAFRNQRWWGKWNDEPVWDVESALDEDIEGLQAVSHIQNCACPECGGKLTWASKPYSSYLLEIWGAVEYAGSGYYRIPEKQFCGDELSPKVVFKLNALKERQLAYVRSRSIERSGYWDDLLNDHEAYL